MIYYVIVYIYMDIYQRVFSVVITHIMMCLFLCIFIRIYYMLSIKFYRRLLANEISDTYWSVYIVDQKISVCTSQSRRQITHKIYNYYIPIHDIIGRNPVGKHHGHTLLPQWVRINKMYIWYIFVRVIIWFKNVQARYNL